MIDFETPKIGSKPIVIWFSVLFLWWLCTGFQGSEFTAREEELSYFVFGKMGLVAMVFTIGLGALTFLGLSGIFSRSSGKGKTVRWFMLLILVFLLFGQGYLLSWIPALLQETTATALDLRLVNLVWGLLVTSVLCYLGSLAWIGWGIRKLMLGID